MWRIRLKLARIKMGLMREENRILEKYVLTASKALERMREEKFDGKSTRDLYDKLCNYASYARMMSRGLVRTADGDVRREKVSEQTKINLGILERQIEQQIKLVLDYIKTNCLGVENKR
jgi:chromosome condensin MukBEF MukE localization factor